MVADACWRGAAPTKARAGAAELFTYGLQPKKPKDVPCVYMLISATMKTENVAKPTVVQYYYASCGNSQAGGVPFIMKFFELDVVRERGDGCLELVLARDAFLAPRRPLPFVGHVYHGAFKHRAHWDICALILEAARPDFNGCEVTFAKRRWRPLRGDGFLLQGHDPEKEPKTIRFTSTEEGPTKPSKRPPADDDGWDNLLPTRQAAHAGAKPSTAGSGAGSKKSTAGPSPEVFSFIAAEKGEDIDDAVHKAIVDAVGASGSGFEPVDDDSSSDDGSDTDSDAEKQSAEKQSAEEQKAEKHSASSSDQLGPRTCTRLLGHVTDRAELAARFPEFSLDISWKAWEACKPTPIGHFATVDGIQVKALCHMHKRCMGRNACALIIPIWVALKARSALF